MSAMVSHGCLHPSIFLFIFVPVIQASRIWSDSCDCDRKSSATDDDLWSEAQADCLKLDTGNSSLASVAYVHWPALCKPQWCCKLVEKADYNALMERKAKHRYAVSLQSKSFVSDLVSSTERVQDRARPLFEDGQGLLLENSTQLSMALLHIQLLTSIQQVIDSILFCDVASFDKVKLPCGAPHMFELSMSRHAQKALDLIRNYDGLLNLIYRGSSDLSVDGRDLLGTTTKLLKAAAYLARRTMRQVSTFGAEVVQATPLFLSNLIRSTGEYFWRRRMMVFIAGVAVMNNVVIADIIKSSMVSTSVSAGFFPLFESMFSQIITKILCPLISNAAVVGFLVHWVIENIIFSAEGTLILQTWLKSFDWLYDAYAWIRAKLLSQKFEPFSTRLTRFLKDLNSHIWAPAVYALMYSHIAGYFKLATSMICLSLQGAQAVSQVTMNAADRVLHRTAGALGNIWDHAILKSRALLGGSVGIAQRVAAKQKLLDSGAGMPVFADYFEQLHRSLVNLQTVKASAGNLVLSTMQSSNDLVELVLNPDFPRSIYSNTLACFDKPWSPMYLLSFGFSSLIAANSFLSSLDPRKISPESMRSFLAYEEDELATAVEEAKQLRVQVGRVTEDQTEEERDEGDGAERHEVGRKRQRTRHESSVWKDTDAKIEESDHALAAFAQRLEGHERLTGEPDQKTRRVTP